MAHLIRAFLEGRGALLDADGAARDALGELAVFVHAWPTRLTELPHCRLGPPLCHFGAITLSHILCGVHAAAQRTLRIGGEGRTAAVVAHLDRCVCEESVRLRSPKAMESREVEGLGVSSRVSVTD